MFIRSGVHKGGSPSLMAQLLKMRAKVHSWESKPMLKCPVGSQNAH